MAILGKLPGALLVTNIAPTLCSVPSPALHPLRLLPLAP